MPYGKEFTGRLSAFHIFEGLQDGLSHFSGPSRVAIIYAISPDSPMRIYDPQNLLDGHEPKLKELYLESQQWRSIMKQTKAMHPFSQPIPAPDPGMTGLIACGGWSRSMFFQMWFTEHHPDMCSTGPTERWLEHAVLLLSQDISRSDSDYIDSSGYVIREYATHAVRDYIVDELNRLVGMDVQIRIYPILDAVLNISNTLEEGLWPRGELVFVEPRKIPDIDFVIRFPRLEQPQVVKTKHVRKLLQAVEQSDRKVVSDGKSIIGIVGASALSPLLADFRGGHGFLKLFGNVIASFANGKFHSSNRKANLVQLEEILLESIPEQHDDCSQLFKIISDLINYAQAQRFGCTVVMDLNPKPLTISGQHMQTPLPLTDPRHLTLAQSLASLDGALHIGMDACLHGFACILDGRTVKGEDLSRGARFNSAIRFTAEHKAVVIVVVSADRPVSIIIDGVELSEKCDWIPLSARLPSPPTLEEWLNS